MIERTAEERLDEIWCGAWEPPDRRTPWEWAEEHVHAIPYSPIPSRFRSINSPWIREPLETLVDVSVKEVQIIAGIQASKTFLMEIGSCYIIKNLPGPMLWLDQTDAEAKDEMENRLYPLWRSTPVVANLIPGSTGSSRHKAKSDVVTFNNAMTAWVKGAHNKKNLQRRSIRWLIGDEDWTWPAGHQAEAKARVTAFGWLGKVFLSSQAGEEGDDCDIAFRAGDQREWSYVCLNPDCERLQEFKWENAEWSPEAKLANGGYDYEMARSTSRIICEECGHEHDTNQDRVRRMMNDPSRGAKFIPKNPNAPKQIVSFHWNGMCSTPIGTLVDLYLRAKQAAKKGDLGELKIFYQKRLAIPWQDHYEDFKMEIEASGYKPGESWDEEATITRLGAVIPTPAEPDVAEFGDMSEFEVAQGEYRRITRGSVPGRIMMVDCQRDHFWLAVRSFNERGDSRLLGWRGGREGEGSVLTWDDVERVAGEFGVSPRLVFVDAGFDTARVYMETGKRGWTAVMGMDRPTFTHRYTDREGVKRSVERFYSPQRRIELGRGISARVHYYSNLNTKDMLARLRRNQDPEQGTTWEVYDGIEDEYLRQMDSEQRIKKGLRYIWEQIGKRPNHLMDCEVIGVNALCMLKLIGKEAVSAPEDDDGEEDPT